MTVRDGPDNLAKRLADLGVFDQEDRRRIRGRVRKKGEPGGVLRVYLSQKFEESS